MGVEPMTATSFVLGHVVLTSYTSSSSFVGLCQIRDSCTTGDVSQTLLDLTLRLMKDPRLVSSLNIGLDLETHAQQYSLASEGLKIRDSLLDVGIIRNCVDAGESPAFHFEGGVDRSSAENLITFQTLIGGANGHAFIVDLPSGLIVYPHDDCGLGFIVSGQFSDKVNIIRMLRKEAMQARDMFNFQLPAA